MPNNYVDYNQHPTANSLQPEAVATLNNAIAQGFGPMFFNIRDPLFGKSNTPVKLKPSFHVPIIIGTLLMLIGLGIAVVGWKTFMPTNGSIYLIVGSYVVYLCASCFCGEIT